MNSQPTSPEITVKFMYRGIYNEDSKVGWLRQFPGMEPIWGKCRFSFDPDLKSYDWLVVYHDLPANRGEGTGPTVENIVCSRVNTLHVTHEPSSITTYGDAYQRQYSHVLTSQEPSCVRHPNRIYSNPGFPWYFGRSFSNPKFISYDDIASTKPKPKTKLLSTVCSSKTQKHTVYHQRFYFTQKRHTRIGPIFDKEFNPLTAKPPISSKYESKNSLPRAFHRTAKTLHQTVSLLRRY